MFEVLQDILVQFGKGSVHLDLLSVVLESAVLSQVEFIGLVGFIQEGVLDV